MDSSEEQTAEEVYEWLSSSSNPSTPKQNANLNLMGHQIVSVSNAETFTNLVAEPVTAPFSLNTADFILNNNDKSAENTVILLKTVKNFETQFKT